MSDIALNTTTDDIKLEKGDLVLTIGREAIRQHLQQRIRSFSGEWFLDLAAGLPYYQSILVKNPNLQAIQGILQAEIIATPGVTELQDFRLNYDNKTRRLTCEFTVSTIDGEIDFAENLEAA